MPPLNKGPRHVHEHSYKISCVCVCFGAAGSGIAFSQPAFRGQTRSVRLGPGRHTWLIALCWHGIKKHFVHYNYGRKTLRCCIFMCNVWDSTTDKLGAVLQKCV
jgi:hypothetical protein